MKKIFSLFMMAMLVVMSSCSETDSPDMPNIQPSENKTDVFQDNTEVNEDGLDRLVASLDSLNATIPDSVSRGSFLRRFGRNLADLGGGYIGSHFFGPIGGMIGNAAASALYDKYVKGEVSESVVLQLKFDGSIKASDMNEPIDDNTAKADDGNQDILLPGINPLSNPNDIESPAGGEVLPVELLDDEVADCIGFYHNYAMVKVSQNGQKYNMPDGINGELLVEDIISYMEEAGFPVETVKYDQWIKEQILAIATEITEVTKSVVDSNGSNSNLINAHCDYFTSKGFTDIQTHRIYREFTAKISEKCQTLSEEGIRQYAISINNFLISSDLDINLKKKLAVDAQCAVNSALCWQQLDN